MFMSFCPSFKAKRNYKINSIPVGFPFYLNKQGFYDNCFSSLYFLRGGYTEDFSVPILPRSRGYSKQ